MRALVNGAGLGAKSSERSGERHGRGRSDACENGRTLISATRVRFPRRVWEPAVRLGTCLPVPEAGRTLKKQSRGGCLRRSGGIGRRSGLKTRFRGIPKWGFESPLRHRSRASARHVSPNGCPPTGRVWTHAETARVAKAPERSSHSAQAEPVGPFQPFEHVEDVRAQQRVAPGCPSGKIQKQPPARGRRVAQAPAGFVHVRRC